MPEPLTPSSSGGASLSLTTSEQLILAVVRAARMAHAPTPELRDAVCAYARELKASGYPPERVLVAAKTLVADAGVRSGRAWADRDSASSDPETGIVHQVVTWCIEEYFPTTEPQHGD